jgi:DedD protein
MTMGLVRNLEQIQETDRKAGGSRLGTLLLASLGGACVIFAVLSQMKRTAQAPAPKADPLGDLVAQARVPVPGASTELAGKDVTFPGILSDDAHTTTALAAVRAAPVPAGSAAPATDGRTVAMAPPPTDRLPVVPLPAKNVVSPSPVVTRPRDALTQMAKEASSLTSPSADEGRPGGYQLQASSFRSEPEATAFASALRQRGHRAYVEPAQLSGRGTWFRVRVGPFKTKREAAAYRAEFEQKEHLAPFIVEPPRDKDSAKKP